MCVGSLSLVRFVIGRGGGAISGWGNDIGCLVRRRKCEF